MKHRNIKILDCTLRDGGYVNNNYFGTNNIKTIVRGLETARVDIIELGYIKNIKEYEDGKVDYPSFFTPIEKGFFNQDSGLEYTLMLLGEEYDINDLEDHKETGIDNIRMTFHRNSIGKAIKYAEIIKEKGYKLYLQPTVTMRYSDSELLELINLCNNTIKPYAFAIVDTFGEMKHDDVIKLTKLFDEKLNKDIVLDFHSHNNLQMAFSNTITFIENCSADRNIVVDSSILGIGRGAGNLCTEIIANELNEKYGKNYDLTKILEVGSNEIEKIKQANPWGYSLEYYLSAIHRCHPSYSIYYLGLKTLNVSDINNILSMISEEKKPIFNKDYAQELYFAFNNNDINDSLSYKKLNKILKDKKILLIGPGTSILEYKKEIERFNSQDNVYSISINNSSIFTVDAIFFGNKKRFREYQEHNKVKNDNLVYLLSSNIEEKSEDKNILFFNYTQLIATDLNVSDNSLLMLINLLIKTGIREIIIAGFDGFNLNDENNFFDINLENMINKNNKEFLNNIIKEYLLFYESKGLNIETITPSLYKE